MDAFVHRVAIGRRFGERIASGDAVFMTGAGGALGLPCTVVNEAVQPFSGVNSFVLLQVMKDQAWVDPRFFTLAQIESAGWALLPSAKKVGLQFFCASGDDGLPLEVPIAKRFHVFNAGSLVGVPAMAGALPLARVANADYFATAAERAGFLIGKDGLPGALGCWLGSLVASRSEGVVQSDLSVALAACLLDVTLGLSAPFDRRAMSSELSDQWAKGIDVDPLSFFHAAGVARVLEAEIMSQVNFVGLERAAVDSLAPLALGIAAAPGLLDGGSLAAAAAVVVGKPVRSVGASARVTASFADRVAVLAVPFADKDAAKALGAVWFGPESVWFVPKGLDAAKFKQWAPSKYVLAQVVSESVLLDSFRDAMASLGLDVPDDVLADGKWHNVAVDSKLDGGRNRSGSYIVSLDGGRLGQPIGTVLNKHTGESFTWTHQGSVLTPEQRARARAESAAREVAAAAAVVVAQDVAAGHAGEIWAAGLPADGHGYVIKKGISADGLRQVAGSVLLAFSEFKGESGPSIIRESDSYLIVPMSNEHGELRAVQAINSTGSVKSFMRGAQKKGTMLVLGAPSFDSFVGASDVSQVAFVEGVATGASFREVSGLPVVVCFDAGNLEAVVAVSGVRLPSSISPVLAVDNDQFHVERALGFLADKLAINPHAAGGEVVSVACGPSALRPVVLGEAVADGLWHSSAKGQYCVSLIRDIGCEAVRSLAVEVVPLDGGRKMSATFSNRGVEAGLVALKSLQARVAQGQAVMVVPEFDFLTGRPSDWNDLASIEGLGACREILRGQGGAAFPGVLAGPPAVGRVVVARAGVGVGVCVGGGVGR